MEQYLYVLHAEPPDVSLPFHRIVYIPCEIFKQLNGRTFSQYSDEYLEYTGRQNGIGSEPPHIVLNENFQLVYKYNSDTYYHSTVPDVKIFRGLGEPEKLAPSGLDEIYINGIPILSASEHVPGVTERAVEDFYKYSDGTKTLSPESVQTLINHSPFWLIINDNGELKINQAVFKQFLVLSVTRNPKWTNQQTSGLLQRTLQWNQQPEFIYRGDFLDIRHLTGYANKPGNESLRRVVEGCLGMDISNAPSFGKHSLLKQVNADINYLK